MSKMSKNTVCTVSNPFLTPSSKNCHMFRKKCALSLAILNFSYSYVFIREPLARHSSHWRCEIGRAGSSRISLASEETPPRCYLLLLVSAYAECSSWIFRERRREKFSGLTTNRRICEGARHEAEKKKRDRKKSTESTRTRRVLWRFFGISLLASRWDIGLRPSDIPRQLPRGIPSWGFLSKRRRWRRDDSEKTVISVLLRSIEKLWESPAKHPVSNTFSTK